MKIENDTLHINRMDLDHILGFLELVSTPNTPPSEIFLEGLKEELKYNGLDGKSYKRIELSFGWEE